MPLADLLNRPCLITRRIDAGAVDTYGNPEPTIDTIEAVCELQQETRTEDGTELSATTWRLFLPAGTPIGTRDTVTVDGEDFEVHGDPTTWRNPRTHTPSHIEATLARRAGAGDPGSPS